MAGSEELGLQEDTLKILTAFLRCSEAAGSPIPTPPKSPAQEETTDFLSSLRRCLPCPLGRGGPSLGSSRPCCLPLRHCYGSETGPATPDFYALVAQSLEQLVQKQLKSLPSSKIQGPPPTEKEALLSRLVALMEEEAEVINQKLASDPALHRKLVRLSERSFAHLVELFSSPRGSSSPNCSSPHRHPQIRWRS